MTAKELVNKFYQPLGTLGCSVSSDQMWAYAKDRAIEVCDMFITRTEMYKGNLNPVWKKWTDLKNEIAALP